MRRIVPWLPLMALLAGLAALWTMGGRQWLSWSALAGQVGWLRLAVAAHRLAAPVGFALAYVAVTALSLPEAALLTVLGGALFGTVLGAAYTVLGATGGAVLLFLAARTALAARLRARAGPLLGRLGPALERDGFFYLLALRLIPVVPFWLVNLAAALAGMRLAPFAAATFAGIIPGTVVFASIGAGLGDVLAAGRPPDLSVILAPRFLLPLAGLAALALLPVLWRRWRGRHG